MFKFQKFIKNKQGQMAIFVVLIFQVLFIFFAMSINVALVVYDKINLQNSLDLASYYGAKKQAEVLNAMAHINYQMRQNWKLLSWRYRILGTLALENSSSTSTFWCPSASNFNCQISSDLSCTKAQSFYSANKLRQSSSFCDKTYFVCTSASFWETGTTQNRGTNLCAAIGKISPITALRSAGGFFTLPIYQVLDSSVNKLRTTVDTSCEGAGATNWLLTQVFLTHFRLDQRDRKTMMQEIYNRSLFQDRDLDGQEIFKTVKQIYLKNLNKSNKKNVKNLKDYGLQNFNSYQGVLFKNVFKAYDVFPILQYFDSSTSSNSGGACADGIIQQSTNVITSDLNRYHRKTQIILPNLNQKVYKRAKILFTLNQRFYKSHADPLVNLSLGFEKLQDKTMYYALQTSFKHDSSSVFSLILAKGIVLRASSVAKAFGASFGPTISERDPLIPIVFEDFKGSGVNLYAQQPNYSRFPGDSWGLLDYNLHSSNSQFLKKIPTGNLSYYNIKDFLHLIFYSPGAADPLARPVDSNNVFYPKAFIRIMESLAIYPDLYDLSYYSISQHYMQSYFPKICKLLLDRDCDPHDENQIKNIKFKAFVRADLSWPNIAKNYRSKNTTNPLKIPAIYPHRVRPISILTAGNLFYPWHATINSKNNNSNKAQDFLIHSPDSLLSSWAPTTVKSRYQKYTFPENFLNCKKQSLNKHPIPSACVVGGRSAYSVKLISCEEFYKIKNKVTNITSYCP